MEESRWVSGWQHASDSLDKWDKRKLGPSSGGEENLRVFRGFCDRKVSVTICVTQRLNTPQALTDKAGQIVWSAQYDKFGAATISGNGGTSSTSSLECNLRFPGQYFDAETGLHYNFHRYYDPSLGRYITEDPVRDGLNWYAYAGSNPVGNIDPLGLADKGEITGERTGFRYYIKTNDRRIYEGIVENEKGVKRLKSELIIIKSKKQKIRELSLYGHGRRDSENIGALQFAITYIPRNRDDILPEPVLKNLLKNLFDQYSKINLELCDSANSPLIIDFFKEVAPEADIFGYDGDAYPSLFDSFLGNPDYSKIVGGKRVNLKDEK